MKKLLVSILFLVVLLVACREEMVLPGAEDVLEIWLEDDFARPSVDSLRGDSVKGLWLEIDRLPGAVNPGEVRDDSGLPMETMDDRGKRKGTVLLAYSGLRPALGDSLAGMDSDDFDKDRRKGVVSFEYPVLDGGG